MGPLRYLSAMRLTIPLTFVALACGGEQKTFESAGAFQTHMTEQGWARLGSFGDLNFPARIRSEQNAKDEITFRTPGGVSHTYPNFTGYDLRVVHLEGRDGSNGSFVYRSTEKR